MNKLINKLRNRKGFTLVEVIVVLVILAILAAVLIPSLTGYIDKANQKAAIAECRSVYLAAQTLASEAYGAGEKTIAELNASGSGYTIGDVLKLAEISESNSVGTTAPFAAVTVSGNKVTKVIYQSASYNVVYANKNYTVTTVANAEAGNKLDHDKSIWATA